MNTCGSCGYSGYAMPVGRGLRGRNYGMMPMGSPYMAGTMEPNTAVSSFSPSSQSFFAGPGGNQEAPATLIVHLPADATLTIDGGYQTQSRESTRVLQSPPLQAGHEYTYELKATATRDGKSETKTEKVKVHAGEHKEVVMNLGGQNSSPERLPNNPIR
jgi:uncharacterized protein (TIGR03000 family)